MKPIKDKIIVRPIPRIQSTLYVQTAEADTVGHIVAVGDEAAEEGLKVGDKIYFGTLATVSYTHLTLPTKRIV